MEWTDLVLDAANTLTRNHTYESVAQTMSREYGEYIHPERLRAALRRWRKRSDTLPMENVYERPVRSERFPAAPHEVVQSVTFGAIGDTHLCSRYERLDILESLYDIFAREGVTRVYHTGNHIDGEARFNKSDIHITGLNNQVSYFARWFPRRHNIVTYFVTGDDHEGWYTQREGIDVGELTEFTARKMGRNDLIYIGHMERDVWIDRENKKGKVRILHPGGGSGLSLGYSGQKIIDSYEENDRPDILLYGHYHKASFLPNYRGVWAIQTGTTSEQSPFMRKGRMGCDLGGWVVTAGLNAAGKVVRVGAEFIAFMPNAWSYKTSVY